MSPPVALVLYCVEWDSEVSQCIQQAWMPAPSLLPPLSVEQAGQILAAALVVFSVAWGVNFIARQITR